MFSREMQNHLKGVFFEDQEARSYYNTDDEQIDKINKEIIDFLQQNLPTNREESLCKYKNGYKIESMEYKKHNPKFMDTLLDIEFIKELHIAKVEDHFRMHRPSRKFSTENCDFFNICRNAVQHIDNCELLTKEDIRIFVSIYCQLHGLNKDVDDEILNIIYERLIKYIDRKYKQ